MFLGEYLMTLRKNKSVSEGVWTAVPILLYLNYCDGSGVYTQGSHLLAGYSTTEATPPAIFCDGFFEDTVLQTICPRLTSNHDPPNLCLRSS
jgi:hypothetical protein